jgi:hypothetical protein
MSAALELSRAEVPGFACEPALERDTLSITFSGTGDVGAIELLADYLKSAHAEAERLAVAEVRCDFRQLLFMNSSCFKAFVVWIDKVKSSPRAYRIRFLTDPEMHWQRRSLEALRRLATNVVLVETG